MQNISSYLEQINELKTARIQMVQAQKQAESYKERVDPAG